MPGLTEQDKKDIAELLKGHECPHGIDAETAAALKDFAKTWQASKKTVVKTIVTWITLAFIGGAIWGIAEKLKSVKP